MDKKKWFQAAGLVLLCHLTITSCQHFQETGDPGQSTRNSLTSTSQSQKEKVKVQTGRTSTETAADKKRDKTKSDSKTKAIPGVTVSTSDGFILTDQSKILSHTNDGIVVEHDGHSHFIFYADLKDTKFAHLIPTGSTLTKPTLVSQGSQQETSDYHHYTFNPGDIVAEDALGYTVRHGDHYHYILKSSLTAQHSSHSTAAAAPTLPSTGFAGNGRADQPMPPVQTGRQETRPSSQEIAGIDYPTSDGFLFDGTGIQGWTDLGLIVDHGGHLHIILKTDLAKSKWAHLLTNQSAPIAPVVAAQPTLSNQPTKPISPVQPEFPVEPVQPDVPSEPVNPVQPEAPLVPTVPQVDEVAAKRAYLAQATGLTEEQIVLLDTPSGPAFMYLHGDHSHLVLLSSLDVTKQFNDGHGGHDHGDDHAHDAGDNHAGHQHEGEDHDGHEEAKSEAPTAPEPSTPEQPAQPSEPAQPELPEQPTVPVQPEFPVEPVQPDVPAEPVNPVQPEAPLVPTVPQVDEVAVKRAYLAQATGLTEEQIVLLDTPSGPAFMYPHGDHSHLVLLSSLDVTKPFDDGHGGHDHGDDHAHDAGDNHAGHQHEGEDHDGHEEATESEAPTAPEPSTPDQPAQPSEPAQPELPEKPTVSAQPEVPAEPVNPVQPEAPLVPTVPQVDEVAVKRAYLAQATGLPEEQIVLLDTPSGPAFMYLHGDHSHLVLLSSLDVTKQFNDGHGGHDHGDDHAHDAGDNHAGHQHEGEDHDGHEEAKSEAPTAPEPSTPTQPTQPSEPAQPELPEKPTVSAQPEVPAEPVNPVQPEAPLVPTVPQVDEVAVKRAYLAQATGLPEEQIVLLDTPSGPAFMYPHGDHSHLVLLSSLDVTKPFDDGHGGHDHGDDHAHDAGDNHAGHQHEGEDHDGHEEATESEAPIAPEPFNLTQSAQPSEAETPEVPEQPTVSAQPEVPSEPVQPEDTHISIPSVEGEVPVSPIDSDDMGTEPQPDLVEPEEVDVPNIPSDIEETQDTDSEEVVSITKPEELPSEETSSALPETPEQPVTPTISTNPTIQTPPGDSDDAGSGDQADDQNAQTDETNHDYGSDQADTTGDTGANQEGGNQAGGETTPPAEPGQPIASVQDEITLKRTYLATAIGLGEGEISLLNTPDGQAFMYPHGDHYHVVLLSQIDVTKPFDDGHGGHGHTDGHDDDHGHDEPEGSDDAHSGDKDSNQDAHTEEASYDDGSDQAGTSEDTGANQDGGDQAGGESTPPAEPTPPSQPTSPVKAGVAGIDYPTSDGFLFDGTGMAGWTSAGLLVNHNGHTHILPTEAIANSKWAHLIPKTDEVTPPAPVELSDKLAKQRSELAKQLDLKEEDIRVVTADGKVVGFEYPHGDHTHLVPVTAEEQPKYGLSEAEKRELTAYIRKTYGLLLGTPVTFHDDFVVFAIPHPHQDYDAKRDYYSDVLDPAYDPGHVHPYAVPLAHLKVLESTGIPELDFENELIAAAKRIGVAPSEVKIEDKKYFVLPGKDHNHYLNILTPREGYEAYMANKLPDIKPEFHLGEYSQEAVVAETDRILAVAEQQLGADMVAFRRVARALETFRANLTVATSSTEGYLKALQSFENKTLKGLVDAAPEAPQEKDELAETYLRLTDELKTFDARTLKAYGVNPEQLTGKLREMVAAKDRDGLAREASYLAAIRRVEQGANELGARLAYMDFFLRHLDSDKLPATLRQEVIERLTELNRRYSQKFREELARTVALKIAVKQALSATQPSPETANWEPYPSTFNRKDMVSSVNGMREFLIRHHEVTAEEVSEGFDQPLELFPVRPKKPVSGGEEKPVQPVEKPVQPIPTSPEPAQPTSPSKPEVPVEATVAALSARLEKLTPLIIRDYQVDVEAWKAKLATAVTEQNQKDLDRIQLYLAAIDRIETAQRDIGLRMAHMDYFIRHLDNPAVSNALRERLAEKSLFIKEASTRDYGHALTSLIDLKEELRLALASDVQEARVPGPVYQRFLEQRAELVNYVNIRRQHLINRGLITAEEKAEDFSQALPLP